MSQIIFRGGAVGARMQEMGRTGLYKKILWRGGGVVVAAQSEVAITTSNRRMNMASAS